jgi:hypothetical protein
MNNLKYAIVEDETVSISAEPQVGKQQPKPFVVRDTRQRTEGSFTSRVEALLDLQFANGSMPA